jgi:hypothetical protein
MQDVIDVMNIPGENSLTTITITAGRVGNILTGKYKDEFGECSIKILLYDFENYGQLFIPDDNVVYIDDFECKPPLKGRGRGRKLLFTVLNYIRSIKGKKTYVTLTAASKAWVPGGNDADLIKYYNRLGFRELEPMIGGLMYANIETVMQRCSPEEFKLLPEPSPEAAATAAVAATAPLARVQPAEEAYFSSVSSAPYFISPSAAASASSSQSSESSQSLSIRPTSVSVEPPLKRFDSNEEGGGKKNHTNKKYTMKTRKNKNKKSKKRWSLKYKKSINCKRPRGFSQRQYCKYGRKKS